MSGRSSDFFEAAGPDIYHDVYAVDRPFSAWTYIFTTSLVGGTPLPWKIFGLLTRWLSALSLWWVLRLVWPKHTREVSLVAILFALYPGFRQQPVSVIYSQYWLNIVLQNLSFAAMLLAVRRQRRFWPLTIIALVFSALTIWTFEYFFGLEFLRPLFLWIALKDILPERRSRLKRVLLVWLPYLAIPIIYVLWRTIFVSFQLYKPVLLDNLREEPWTALLTLVSTMAADIVTTTAIAWASIFSIPRIEEFGRISTLAFLGVLGLSLALLLLYFLRYAPGADAEARSDNRRWGLEALFVALAALMLAGWPIWVPQLDLQLVFPFDRFTMPFMLGSSLLLVAVVELLIRNKRLLMGVMALVVALSIAFQFKINVDYRRAWEEQKRFIWELAWRIPDLEEGTALFTNELRFGFVTDLSLTMPINLMYADGLPESGMSYFLFNIRTRSGRSILSFEENTPIAQTNRATSFYGNTSQVLTVLYLPPRCLRVIDEVLDDSSPLLGGELKPAVPLSRIELIDPLAQPPARPPEAIFGAEPGPSWCFYFQKADLARQSGDWRKVAELGDAALAFGDQPNQASERIPFIEGYAHVGRWDMAARLTEDAIRHDAAVRRMLCHAWGRIQATASPDREAQATIDFVRADLDCD